MAADCSPIGGGAPPGHQDILMGQTHQKLYHELDTTKMSSHILKQLASSRCIFYKSTELSVYMMVNKIITILSILRCVG